MTGNQSFIDGYNMEGLEKKALQIIHSLPIEVYSYEPINWKRVQTTPIFILYAKEGKYVLKLFPSPRGLIRKILNFLFGNLGLKNQVFIYEYLNKHEFSQFCVPILVSSDSLSYLLFKYIDIEHKREYEIDINRVVNGLIEFSFINSTKINFKILRKFIGLSRKPLCVIIRRVFGSLRKKYGSTLAIDVFRMVVKCYLRQKPFLVRFLIHNDFHHNNIFFDRDGKLYISDFENSIFESRWILLDIVHYSVGTQKFSINTSAIKEFFSKFMEKNADLEINFHAQLLLAFFLRISQMILSPVPTEDVQKRYFNFLSNVLLDEHNFRKWLSKNFYGC